MLPCLHRVGVTVARAMGGGEGKGKGYRDRGKEGKMER